MRTLVLIAVLAWSGAALAADIDAYKADLPNAALTPGEANPVLTQEKICGPGFRTAQFRHVTTSLKSEVFRSYGIACRSGKRVLGAQAPGLAFAHASAFPTRSRSVLSEFGVGTVKGVSTRAMGPLSLDRAGACTAQDVFTMSDGIEMLGIYASGVPAKMIKFSSGRDGADKPFISEDVRSSGLPVSRSIGVVDATISTALHWTFCPIPTPLVVDQDISPKRGVDVLAKRLSHEDVNSDLPICNQWEIDHVISIELAGANTRRNLFPQRYTGTVWNAHVKDKLENRLHKLVCAGKVTLEEAQREISTDWIASWRMRFGRDVP